MKNVKKIIQIILVSTSLLILSGCSDFSKEDLKIPIQDYLKLTMVLKMILLLYIQMIIGLKELTIRLQ